VRRRALIAVALALVGLAAARLAMVAADRATLVTAAHMAAIADQPPRLRALLQQMPKGADLHTHLSGAVYAERLIAWAAADGACLRWSDTSFVPPPRDADASRPCGADPALVPLREALSGPGGQAAHDRLVNAFSLRWFLPTPEVPSGHDQFFGSFGRFSAATGGATWQASIPRIVDMTLDQLQLYEAENVQHAEFMLTFFSGDERRRLAAALAGRPTGDDSPQARLAALQRAGLAELVATRVADVAAVFAQIESRRGCATAAPAPGCRVTFSYIAQVSRNTPVDEVFVQTALAAALVRAVPDRVVGFNYVGPEDYRIARADYRAHMAIIAALAGPDVPVALHAGELWLGLVPPDDLTFHIRLAVEEAGARRIGHGTAVPFEDDSADLIAEMRRRNVAVEIALTSSDVILGVRGRAHPISAYRQAGVPLVLATDDAGVSRIDLTNEYLRAVTEHGFTYGELKQLVHASITHAFLPPAEKQRQLARLDAAFASFETTTAAQRPPSEVARALLRAAVFAGP